KLNTRQERRSRIKGALANRQALAENRLGFGAAAVIQQEAPERLQAIAHVRVFVTHGLPPHEYCITNQLFRFSILALLGEHKRQVVKALCDSLVRFAEYLDA